MIRLIRDVDNGSWVFVKPSGDRSQFFETVPLAEVWWNSLDGLTWRLSK